MKIIIMIDRCLSMLTSSVEKLPSTFPVAAAMIACRRVGKQAMIVSFVACDDGGDDGDDFVDIYIMMQCLSVCL